MAGGGGEGESLEYTPTWVVAVVCTVIVGISLFAERFLHFGGKYLLKKNQTYLFLALQKIKEELMLVGFISLLLAMFQGRISKACIPKHLTDDWLPCKKINKDAKSTSHFVVDYSAFSNFFIPGQRRLLAASSDTAGYCEAKGKAPLLSLTAVHDLHIFIFVLAVAHVLFSVSTIFFGGLKIKEWKHWEDAIQKEEYDPEQALKTKITHLQDDAFIHSRFSGISRIALISWLKSFFKQFHGSVKQSDYTTLRLGFIMLVSWVFVVIFLLLNVYGWHAYFWISFVPLVLMLGVGTKLEHIITQLAHEVAQKHIAVTGDVVINPSDDHFWFHRPRLVLVLIHIVLFQNAFEIAIFFWMLFNFGFDSCIMGEVGYIIPRLVIGVFVQFVCSYSTLPLYAIVAQMGSSFNRGIFDDNIHAGIVGWAQKAKKNKGLLKKAIVSEKGTGSSSSSNQVAHQPSPKSEIEVQQVSSTNQHKFEIKHAI